jgi:hypothetical protein
MRRPSLRRFSTREAPATARTWTTPRLSSFGLGWEPVPYLNAGGQRNGRRKSSGGDELPGVSVGRDVFRVESPHL